MKGRKAKSDGVTGAKDKSNSLDNIYSAAVGAWLRRNEAGYFCMQGTWVSIY